MPVRGHSPNTTAPLPADCPRAESPSAKIIELRTMLAQKFPASSPRPRARLPTGVSALDHLLDGGVAKGALTEVVCPRESTGSGTLIHALIESAATAKRHLALVDGGKSFDPDGLENHELASMLWVQCAGPKQAVQAADLLLRDGNLSLIVLDLVMCPVREVQGIPSSSWYRLQRVTEGNGSAALIFTPSPVVSSASYTLRLEHAFELPALDLLRDQLTTSLQFQRVHTRSTSFLSQRFA